MAADRRRLSRRGLCGAVAALAIVRGLPRVALAQDPASALRDLGSSSDFRIRVSAALYIGRSKPAGALEALEHALSDAHPAVRSAAATALGQLGDPAAIGALARRKASEPSASVKAQLQSSIDQLRHGASEDGAVGDVRFVVRLGPMRNPSGVRGDDLRRVLENAARVRARALRGGAVLEGDGPLLAQAKQRHWPIYTLDGSVLQLTESRVESNLQVQARVEFAVRRDQTLKGTLSGAATTFGSGPTISDQGRRQLEDDAVDAAVQSALRGVEQQILVAAL